MPDDPQPRGFWGRATFAVALALYGWSMMGLQLYLRAADAPEGPARALALFRRLVMGRGVVALGGAAVLASIILAVIARRNRRWSVVALVLCAAWIALFLWMLPTI